MKPGTIALSKDLRGIALALDEMIESSAGERVAFTLLVFTEDRASYISYISTAAREDSVREMRRMLDLWEQGMPDIPAHDVAA